MDAGCPIWVEFLVPMEGHSDTDSDLSEHVDNDIPDMFKSDDDCDEPDPRSRFAIPS